MKFLTYILFSLSVSAQALTFEVTGEDGATLFSATTDVELPLTVGEISIQILENNGVPYLGGPEGLSEIFGLGSKFEGDPQNLKDWKAFGWCFEIDGAVPETMANETRVTRPDSKIEWFYAYAHFKGGEWISQCARKTGPLYFGVAGPFLTL